MALLQGQDAVVPQPGGAAPDGHVPLDATAVGADKVRARQPLKLMTMLVPPRFSLLVGQSLKLRVDLARAVFALHLHQKLRQGQLY